MGNISSQASRSTFYSIIGVALGFLTVGILFPRILEPGEIGVLRLVQNYSEIAARIAALGTSTLMVRYYPVFKSRGIKGILSSMILVNLAGFLLIMGAYYLSADFFIERNAEKSPLFSQYFYWIVPVTLSFVIYNLFDSYANALKMSAMGIFFRDFFQRFFIVILLAATWYWMIPFDTTLTIYFSIILATPLMVIAFLKIKKSLFLEWNLNWKDTGLTSEMMSVGGFALLTGIGGTMVVFIDNIMLNELMNESKTGIYSTIFFYTAVIAIPSKSISKIAPTFIAEAFVNDEMEKIRSIYYKSCMNQFLPGLFIFIMIWVNEEFIFYILPEPYYEGRYLLLILGFGNLFNALTGINTQIIAYSKLYRYNTYFIVGLIIITILSNLYFIPKFGIIGAGIATAISLFAFNMSKYILILSKYGFQPFNFKYITLMGIAVASIYGSKWIELDNPFFDLITRTAVASILFAIPVYFLRISPEINQFLVTNYEKYILRK